jgi:hypothetical protein
MGRSLITLMPTHSAGLMDIDEKSFLGRKNAEKLPLCVHDK